MAHAGHGFVGYDMEHFDDGTGTVEFQHEKGADHNKKYAYVDLDDLHDKLEDHLRGLQEVEEGMDQIVGDHEIEDHKVDHAGDEEGPKPSEE